MEINEICASFAVGGDYIGSEELNTGIINRTYHVHYIRDGVPKSYIVQRINTAVFKEPYKVMDNIVRVTGHIREKMRQNGESTKTGVLRAFKTVDDKYLFVDNEGGYWRCYRYIENSVTYDTTSDYKIIAGAGFAFGRFQKLLNDFDAKSLYIPLKDFHNTIKRYEHFDNAIKTDPLNRANSVAKEIKEIQSFLAEACMLQKYLDSGEIPYRVTHNDTKCNNVCFDINTGKVLAVLDLDTVMPGAIAHDFGDAIRFIANSVIEDCPDTSKVYLDLDKYEVFSKGFLKALDGTLTDMEKSTLNLGVFAMTVELAMRFLTDYIMGDKYFKIKYFRHNLDRARNQIALAKDIKKKMAVLDYILSKYI